jgi:branched-chain amino acid transport system ATP-binding protein
MSLEISQLSACLGDAQVLSNVTLDVAENGLTGLIGPNGAGKSTLFAVVSGLLKPTSGRVRLGDVPLDGRDAVARAHLGLVRTFQVPREFRGLSVRDNLMAAAPDQPGEHLLQLLTQRARIRSRESEIRDKADETISFLKLDAMADVLAGQLSGGQKKLLELGRVMMLRPKLVLLDEPFAGVNAVLIGEIVERIRALHARGIGFFIIEHDLGALSDLVETMHVLDHGCLLASGPPGAVLADLRVREAYLGGVPA